MGKNKCAIIDAIDSGRSRLAPYGPALFHFTRITSLIVNGAGRSGHLTAPRPNLTHRVSLSCSSVFLFHLLNYGYVADLCIKAISVRPALAPPLPYSPFPPVS